MLFITAFVDMVGYAMILPLLPFYASQFGASATVVGVLVSAFAVAQLLIAPVWGRWSDRFGRRPAIIGGLVVTAAGYALFGVAGSVLLLLVSRVVQGLGGGTIGVVQAYVADVSAPEDRTRSLGWLSAVTSMGAVVGPAIGSVLVRAGGQMAPGLVAAVFSLLVAAFGWRYLAETRPAASGQSDTSVDSGATTEEHQVVSRASTGFGAIRRVLTHRGETANRLIWTYALGIGAFYGTIPIVPLLLEARLGVTEATIGYFIMYLGGMGVLMRAVVLGPLVDRLGERRLARLGMLALAAGLVVVAMGTGYPAIIVGFTLMPIGTACLFPCITAMLSHAVRVEDRGLYLGVQQMFGGVTRVAFPIMGGIAMDRAGMGTPFAVAGALVIALVPLLRGVEKSAGAQERKNAGR